MYTVLFPDIYMSVLIDGKCIHGAMYLARSAAYAVRGLVGDSPKMTHYKSVHP